MEAPRNRVGLVLLLVVWLCSVVGAVLDSGLSWLWSLVAVPVVIWMYVLGSQAIHAQHRLDATLEKWRTVVSDRIRELSDSREELAEACVQLASAQSESTKLMGRIVEVLAKADLRIEEGKEQEGYGAPMLEESVGR